MRYIDWIKKQIKFLGLSNVIRFPIEKRLEQSKKITHQVWYIPRMEDELPIASFNNLEDAIQLMTKIKKQRPKAFPHHYIWDVARKQKINYEKEI